jgi:uncharacterized membrane protein
MRIEIGRPAYLLLLLLIPLCWWTFRRARRGPLPWPDRFAMVLRAVLIGSLALVLSEPRWVTQTKGRATAFVQDVSESVPQEARRDSEKRINAWLLDREPEHEDVSYIVFADGTGIETPFKGLGGLRPEDIRPMDPGRVGSVLERGETDVEAALRATQASFPPEVARRVVLLTDGNETRGSAESAVRDLRAAGVEVLVYPLRYKRSAEVLVEKVVAPPRARTGQPVPVRAVVVSTEDARPATVRFSDADGRGLATSEVTLRKGRNVYEVRQSFDNQGLHVIRVNVESLGDGDPANTRGTAAVFTEGNPAVLIAAREPKEAEPIRRALAANELHADLIPLGELPQGPGGLLPYECVVLVNAPASELSTAQMRMLKSAVEEIGIGLLAVGGPDSYSAGSWGGTPLEEVLPVEMDVRQKRVLPNGACVVVLHTCEFPQGNDWARKITKAVVYTLGRNDYFGCVDWEMGGGVYWVVSLSKADPPAMAAAIDRANPCDMPSLHDCVSAGVNALLKANAYCKHMIVVSDGDPAMPSQELIRTMVDNQITISAVAIAQHGMQDAMKPMTEATGGRYYALNEGEVETLPAIFMKEASVVRRSAVSEKPVQPQVLMPHEMLKGIPAGEIPILGGYVVTSARDRAEVVLAEPENGDPLLAVWRKGLGVSAAFTSDLAGRWGKDWVAWGKYDKAVSQIVRACSRGLQKSPFGISVEASGGTGRVVIEAVDAQGNYVDALSFDGTALSPSGKSAPLRILQMAQGRYEGTFAATEPGLYLVALTHEAPGAAPGAPPQRLQLRAACPVDYSPEHLALGSDEAFFARLSAAGATLLKPEDHPFQVPLPETRTLAETWRWILLLAALLFPFEVAARRLRLDPGPMVARLRDRARGIAAALPKPRPRSGPTVVVTGREATAGRAGVAAEAAAAQQARAPGTTAVPGAAAAKPGDPAKPVAPGASDDLLKAKRRAKRQQTWEDNA